jgi:putative photosynthetic complex assembly protein
MSEEFEAQPFPRAPLIAVALLLAATLALVVSARMMGRSASAGPPAAAIASRELVFQDREDGTVRVVDAHSRATIQVIERSQNGFLRATMRGLARDRRSRGVGSEAPFRLTERSDGALTLEDPSTGRIVNLEAFGRTNSGSFERFLDTAAHPNVPASAGENPL